MTKPGIYTFKVDGHSPAAWPSFRIGRPVEIYAQLLQNALFFFQVQRDGPAVPLSALRGQPSHLTDKQAFVYEVPAFGKNGLQGDLKRIGGPVDVSGGWFEAGDYVICSDRELCHRADVNRSERLPGPSRPGQPGGFRGRRRYGLGWLLRMWHDDTKTLYCQAGIGDGNQNVAGDHDRWRLPEADDKLDVAAGALEYFLKYRPVFQAGPAGAPISPNLADRLAAAFALG